MFGGFFVGWLIHSQKKGDWLVLLTDGDHRWKPCFHLCFFYSLLILNYSVDFHNKPDLWGKYFWIKEHQKAQIEAPILHISTPTVYICAESCYLHHKFVHTTSGANTPIFECAHVVVIILIILVVQKASLGRRHEGLPTSTELRGRGAAQRMNHASPFWKCLKFVR